MRLDKLDLPAGVCVRQWLRDNEWLHLVTKGDLQLWAKPSKLGRVWEIIMVRNETVSIVNHQQGFAAYER